MDDQEVGPGQAGRVGQHDEVLLTSRLALRRPVRQDAGAIFSIHSDPRTCVHNPSDALATREDAELLFERWDEHWRQFGFGYWVVRWRNSEQPLGFCGVKVMQLAGSQVLNLFCRLDPLAWGHGVGSEATAGVVRWASRRLPEYSLIARVRPENLASQRVVTHAGLIRAEHLDGPGFDGLDWIYVLPSSAITP
jgi:RimJ/RimL family protein N-acetyltransferase